MNSIQQYLATHSWKTTSVGLTSIIGGLVRIGFMIKAGGVSEEGVMTTVTTILTGIGFLLTRDNDKSTESVQKDKPTVPPIVSIILIACILSLGSGCKTSAPDVAVKVSDTSKVTVEAALRAWDAYIVANHPPIESQRKVRDAYNEYRACQLLVLKIAIIVKDAELVGETPANYDADLSRAIADTSNALADLLKLLQTFKVKI